jgi:hypothetical protein
LWTSQSRLTNKATQQEIIEAALNSIG